uniref:U4/U6 small nuclear ribonucleoprotein Prp3 n=1 Tax=Cacopsylla melanoneura TaxID=428564 RepID=A0A8D8M182_9HEMI
MVSISKRDVDEFKSQLNVTVEHFLGFNEPSIVTVATNCLLSGYDLKETTKKLNSLLDSDKAEKLAEKIINFGNNFQSNLAQKVSKKRHHEDDVEPSKKPKISSSENGELPKPGGNPADLSQNQIKNMMANAQKMIEERKKALLALKANGPNAASTTVPPKVAPAAPVLPAPPKIPSLMSLGTVPPPNAPPSTTAEKDNATYEKAMKIAQLQAQIQTKLNAGIIKPLPPGLVGAKPAGTNDKPTPLILDSEGRTIDITGKQVQLTHVVPTLKANIRAKKREEFHEKLKEKPTEDLSESKFFDPRISAKPSVRNKRALKFHEPGKFQQLAEQLRVKAQLAKLQADISKNARKTGISSATKLALIAPRIEDDQDEIPEVEWWDMVIMNQESYDVENNVKKSTITNLVEHPIQIKPTCDMAKPVYMPVFLTDKERKKLRRQNRREAWKEEQEKIRLGLEPPPEPKLRISNLMRVLGTEAVQDPTKMEAHVRAQMAKRQKDHEEANASRKLTVEQKRDKKIRKIKEDTSLEVYVAVYRVDDFTNPSKKFKVETNCNQLFMTGAVVMYKDCNVIVVEGGPKQQSKFKRLMTHRIKWEEDMIKSKDGTETPNKCVLVWEGTKKERSFGEMKFKVCVTEVLAREQFKKRNVEQYWDLCYSKTVLDNVNEK